MHDLMDQVGREGGIATVSMAVDELMSRERGGSWGNVRTNSEAISVLLSAGASQNSRTIRRAVRWLLSRQDRGAWNDEVWDTSVAVMTLHRVGHSRKSPPVEKGIRALLDQYDESSGSWWDLWETCFVVRCFNLLGVEPERAKRATNWLMEKRYPAPAANWLNIHTTAAVLETLATTDWRQDPRAKEAAESLQALLANLRRGDIDTWSLSVGLRALHAYLEGPLPLWLQEKLRGDVALAVEERTLDTVDLCEATKTLLTYAPSLLAPATRRTITEVAETDEPGLAALVVSATFGRFIGKQVADREEAAPGRVVFSVQNALFSFSVTRIGIQVAGLFGVLVTVISLALGIALAVVR